MSETGFVIIGCGQTGKSTIMLAIIERLKTRGCNVIVVEREEVVEQPIESLQVMLKAPVHDVDCKIDFCWKRERDYPTLKQGLRDPKFRKRGKI